jgi:DNA polymerase-3 subunit epsilon
MIDFVAIDFETATAYRSSPCEIGLTFVRNGEITETKSWLIKPPQNRFDLLNIMVHGIKPKDVADKPEFDELWEELKPLIENQFLIAHNASFDMSVLRKTLENYELPIPSIQYACSYLFSKKVWTHLPRYDLKTLCQFNQIYFNHHRAGDDSKATAELSLKAFEKAEIDSIGDLYDKLKVNVKQLDSKNANPKSVKKQPVVDLTKRDASSIFYGKNVVFTGTLSSMSRTRAHQIIMNIGGSVSNQVTNYTHFLIVGSNNNQQIGVGYQSRKYEMALQVIEWGCSLEIISEEVFLNNV